MVLSILFHRQTFPGEWQPINDLIDDNDSGYPYTLVILARTNVKLLDTLLIVVLLPNDAYSLQTVAVITIIHNVWILICARRFHIIHYGKTLFRLNIMSTKSLGVSLDL